MLGLEFGPDIQTTLQGNVTNYAKFARAVETQFLLDDMFLDESEALFSAMAGVAELRVEALGRDMGLTDLRAVSLWPDAFRFARPARRGWACSEFIARRRDGGVLAARNLDGPTDDTMVCATDLLLIAVEPHSGGMAGHSAAAHGGAGGGAMRYVAIAWPSAGLCTSEHDDGECRRPGADLRVPKYAPCSRRFSPTLAPRDPSWPPRRFAVGMLRKKNMTRSGRGTSARSLVSTRRGCTSCPTRGRTGPRTTPPPGATCPSRCSRHAPAHIDLRADMRARGIRATHRVGASENNETQPDIDAAVPCAYRAVGDADGTLNWLWLSSPRGERSGRCTTAPIDRGRRVGQQSKLLLFFTVSRSMPSANADGLGRSEGT